MLVAAAVLAAAVLAAHDHPENYRCCAGQKCLRRGERIVFMGDSIMRYQCAFSHTLPAPPCDSHRLPTTTCSQISTWCMGCAARTPSCFGRRSTRCGRTFGPTGGRASSGTRRTTSRRTSAATAIGPSATRRCARSASTSTIAVTSLCLTSRRVLHVRVSLRTLTMSTNDVTL
jgi:hypothetical protein